LSDAAAADRSRFLEALQRLHYIGSITAVASLTGALANPHILLLLLGRHEGVLSRCFTALTVDGTIGGSWNLLVERSNEALLVAEVAELLCSAPEALRIVLPGVTSRTDALPVVAARDLVSLLESLAVVELSIKLYHAEVQRLLNNVWVAVDEHVVIRPILLQALVLNSAGDVSVTRGPHERLRDT